MTASADAEPGKKGAVRELLASPALRLAAGGGALLVIAALLFYMGLALRCARDAIAYPFELAYGEGLLWQETVLIPGPRMYGPIDQPPYISFPYPPFYHLVVRMVMALGVDPLAAGRLVSVMSTAVILLCIAWLVAAGLAGRVRRFALLVGAITGALLPLSFAPLQEWFVLMRVDMLAIALAFVGVVLAVRAGRRTAWLAVAMPLFVLAVYTKQTEICAPAAALVVLLVVKPRAAIVAGLGGAVLGLAALAWLEWMTKGGFARHIFYYNIDTWTFRTLASLVWKQLIYVLIFVMAVAGLAVLRLNPLTHARRRDPANMESRLVVPIVSLWLLLGVGLMAATLGKFGAWANYFIEPMCVCAIPIGILVGLGWQAVVDAAGPREMWLRLGLVLVVLGLATEMARRRPMFYEYDNIIHDAGRTALRGNLVREIAAQDRPVLSEDMVLLLRAGQEVPIEQALFSDLARTGKWDARPFLDAIAARAFGFVIMLVKERYTPAMLAAIEKAYPRVETRREYVIRYPDGD